MKCLVVWLVAVHLISACGRPDRTTDTAFAASTRRVDSFIPVEEALRRFRGDAPRPESLTGGADSREKLVRTFAGAVEALDTATLRRMAVKADEFAWFYYPFSPISRPPYELPPALTWFHLQGESSKGFSRLLARLGGRRFHYAGHNCEPPIVQGKARLYSNCVVRRLVGRDTVVQRLFGPVIEQDGAHKFVSYSNGLD